MFFWKTIILLNYNSHYYQLHQFKNIHQNNLGQIASYEINRFRN